MRAVLSERTTQQLRGLLNERATQREGYSVRGILNKRATH